MSFKALAKTVLLVGMISAVITEEEHCTKLTNSLEAMSNTYLVPVAVSTKRLVAFEEKNIYYLSVSNDITVERMTEYTPDCILRRKIMIRSSNLSNVQSIPMGTHCDLADPPVIPDYLTGLVISGNNIFLIISCDKSGRNVTVLVSCFIYWSFGEEYNFTGLIMEFFKETGVEMIKLYKINSRRRLQTHFDFLDKVVQPNSKSSYRNCPEPRDKFTIATYTLIIVYLSTFMVVGIVLFRCKLQPQNRITPQRISVRSCN